MRNLTAAQRPKVSQQEIATPTACNSLTKKRKLTYTQKLTYAATLTAIALIFKLISQALGSAFQLLGLKLSFIYIPWIIAGAALGPLYGMTVALTTDVLGTFLLPTALAVSPIVTLSNTLFPLFVWLAVRFLPVKNLFFKITVGTAVSTLFCTLGLSTLGLSLLLGTPFWAQLAMRAVQPIIITLNLLIVGLLIPLLKKLRLA